MWKSPVCSRPRTNNNWHFCLVLARDNINLGMSQARLAWLGIWSVTSNSNPNPNNLNLNQHTAWDIQTLFSRHLQKRRDIPPQICWQRRRVTSQSDSSKMIHRLFCFIRKKVRWPPGSRKRNFSLKLIRKIPTKIKHSMRNGKNRKSKLEC